jgi:hypothetical protein
MKINDSETKRKPATTRVPGLPLKYQGKRERRNRRKNLFGNNKF